MKRFLKISRYCGLSLSAAICCTAMQLPVAAQQSTTATAILHFTFRDSARGTVVRPDAILIDNKPIFIAVDEAGRMSVPVTPGDHQVLIKAQGYDDMDSRQTASLDQAPMNLVLLDPVEQPEELQPDILNHGMPADGTEIVGYVTDQSMGRPIKGAKAEILGKDVTATTDERGFFKLPVHIKDGKKMPDDPLGVVYDTRDFRVTAPGYGFEEHVNVLVESGTPKIYQVQMTRGGGGNTSDEAGTRNNLQSSLFGLINVEPEDYPSTYSTPLEGPRTSDGWSTSTGTGQNEQVLPHSKP